MNEQQHRLLSSIDSPADLRKLDEEQLPQLSSMKNSYRSLQMSCGAT